MSIEKTNVKKEIQDDLSQTVLTYEIIPYTQVYTHVIQNIYHAEAGFVWVYLLSKPENWDVIKEHLKSHFNIGNDKMKEIFAYLSEHQLIEYVTVRDPRGRFLRLETRVLNGSRFITDEQILENQQLKELSTRGADFATSTGGQNRPLVSPAGGFQEAINKRAFKKEKEKQKGVFVDKNEIESKEKNYYAELSKPIHPDLRNKNISNVKQIFDKNPELKFLREKIK